MINGRISQTAGLATYLTEKITMMSFPASLYWKTEI